MTSTTAKANRARDLGIPLPGSPGPYNAITDVPGVEVGYATLIRDQDIRTGVTGILPLGRDNVGRSCPAGWFSLNGNGEMTGTALLAETGALSLPIGITSTHSVGPVHQGIIDWSIRQNPLLGEHWLLPVVAETWDGYLNDLNAHAITAQTTSDALDAATGGPIEEGSVGGGTGMNCYGYKGGTGTASRVVTVGTNSYTVGVLTQANFGSRNELTIAGRHLGPQLLDDNPVDDSFYAPPGAGSCIVVIATDAPLIPTQCTALARRASLGLARTGTTGSHYSGDIFLGFSATNIGVLDSNATSTGDTAVRSMRVLPWGALDPLFEAVAHSVEESVLNVLVGAETMIGREGRRSPGFPTERLPELLDVR